MSDNQEPPTNPTDEQLEEWFKKYGALFRVQVLDRWFLFRYLTRREYRLLLMMDDEIERADRLCETVILWPPNYKVLDEDPAGLAESLSKEVLRQSGFADDMKERFESHHKMVADNIEPQMEAIIEYVFGNNGGKFDYYQDWSHEQLFESYQRALWILQVVEAKEHLATKPQEKPLTPQDVLKSLRKEAADEGRDPHNINMAEAMAKYRKLQRETAIRARTPEQQTPANRPPMAGVPGDS